MEAAIFIAGSLLVLAEAPVRPPKGRSPSLPASLLALVVGQVLAWVPFPADQAV